MAKILLIEDDEGVRKYISKILEMMGHEVLIAEEGGKGYELAKAPEIKAILTDLSMPGSLSEMQLVRKLRELRPECPIVVCSGYPTQDRLEECETLGITDFLTKPFEVSFIRSVMARLLDEPAAGEKT
jgi:DNA-binding NtrC family response regulator